MKHRPSHRRAAPRRVMPVPSQSYDGLLDGLPIGVVLLNDQGIIHTMNAEGARLCGGPAEQYIGKSFPELWHVLTGMSPESIHRIIQQVHQDAHPWQRAHVVLHQHPESGIPVEWTCLPASFDRQRGLAVSLKDISHEDRKSTRLNSSHT